MKMLLNNEFEAFERALQAEQPISVRINKLPKFTESNPFQNLPQVLWCASGYYLPKRPVFTLDPLLHAGTYYVQEAASMYLEQCIKHIINKDNTPKIALDLCAAPGGKSTHMASLLPQNSLLISNEIIRSRANILRENMAKWGSPNSVITNNDPRDFASLPNFFDIVLVDAPCSGEGMFRKDAGAINEWSENNVQLCAERQRRILADVWDTLKPSGYLIYSTCTYNLEENEKNVSWLMNEFGAASIPVNFNDSEKAGITPSFIEGIYAARFFPHKTKSEGLFMALLRKPNDSYSPARLKNEKSKYQKLNKELNHVTKWLNELQKWNFVQNESSIIALPADYSSEIELLNKRLRVLSVGVAIGEIKGKTIVPDATLALSTALNKSEFNIWDVDTETALNFLRRENIVAPADLPNGYILLVYNNIPLGWIKNLGNRSNNLYPQEWRIRHL